MEIYYYTLFTLFAVICIMMVIDPNVGVYIDLLAKFVKSKFTRAYMLVWLHPKNPIFRYKVWRRSMKMAEEVRKEYDNK